MSEAEQRAARAAAEAWCHARLAPSSWRIRELPPSGPDTPENKLIAGGIAYTLTLAGGQGRKGGATLSWAGALAVGEGGKIRLLESMDECLARMGKPTVSMEALDRGMPLSAETREHYFMVDSEGVRRIDRER